MKARLVAMMCAVLMSLGLVACEAGTMDDGTGGTDGTTQDGTMDDGMGGDMDDGTADT